MYHASLLFFSSAIKREFDLNKYTKKADILKAVDAIKYEAGGTNTHLALDEMRVNGFKASNGARPTSDGHPRVAIVLTDGQSNQPQLTVTAALRVHDADITVRLERYYLVWQGNFHKTNKLNTIVVKRRRYNKRSCKAQS